MYELTEMVSFMMTGSVANTAILSTHYIFRPSTYPQGYSILMSSAASPSYDKVPAISFM